MPGINDLLRNQQTTREVLDPRMLLAHCALRSANSRRSNQELAMAKTFSLKFKICVRLLAPLLFSALQSQVSPTASAQDQASKQHFVCSVGYTQQQCAVDMAVLSKVLAKYPVDALSEWTWVLVRPEDWRRILLDRGFSPDSSPAFSILPHRETFLEGALVTKVSFRGAQLSTLWRMPIEDLLDLAVRHELGHALCNERNEAQADRIAAVLQKRKPISCAVQTVKSGARRLPAIRSGAR
jgi:hypothetical protein